ncbi:MAG: CdaR family protein [Lachnospiraceae bacterium]|nr:CdaR family protein [Lachnospiraceae bacterium]
MNKFKQLLMKDFGWKLLSLAIAICLWFIVINIEDPVETRNFSVTLEILNDSVITDRGQTISNYDEIYGQKINVRIRGQRIALDRLYQNRGEIHAYIDLNNLDETPGYGETVSTAVVVKLPSSLSASYEIEGKSPGAISLVIENRVSVEKDIVLDIQGSADASYTLATPELTPQKVTISGSQTMVDSVDKVKATVNLANIKEDTHYTATLVAYDVNGMQVTGISLSVKTVDVYIPVKMSKKVKLVYSYTGTPKDGFIVESITCDPEYVYVLGDEEVLKGINEIELPPVNVEGKETDTKMTFGIKYFLGDGVKLKDGTSDKVIITANIVKESTKTVTLKADNISFKVELAQGLSAEVAPEDITFDVRGSKAAIDALTDEQIAASLTVTNVEAGEYSMPLKVTLPDGINFVEADSPVISVRVVEKEEEPASEEGQ